MKRIVMAVIIAGLLLLITPIAIASSTFLSVTQTITQKIVAPAPSPGGGGVSVFKLYDLVVENITEDSADILWKTSRSTTSELTYWLSSGVTVENDEYIKEHLVHLEELKDDTAYSFEVTCRDKYGSKKSAEGEFTTLEKEIVPEPELILPEPEEPIKPEEPVLEPEEPTEPEEPVKPIEPGEEEEEVIMPPGTPWGLIRSVVGGLAVAGGIGYWLWLWLRRRKEARHDG